MRSGAHRKTEKGLGRRRGPLDLHAHIAFDPLQRITERALGRHNNCSAGIELRTTAFRGQLIFRSLKLRGHCKPQCLGTGTLHASLTSECRRLLHADQSNEEGRSSRRDTGPRQRAATRSKCKGAEKDKATKGTTNSSGHRSKSVQGKDACPSPEAEEESAPHLVAQSGELGQSSLPQPTKRQHSEKGLFPLHLFCPLYLVVNVSYFPPSPFSPQHVQ